MGRMIRNSLKCPQAMKRYLQLNRWNHITPHVIKAADGILSFTAQITWAPPGK